MFLLSAPFASHNKSIFAILVSPHATDQIIQKIDMSRDEWSGSAMLKWRGLRQCSLNPPLKSFLFPQLTCLERLVFVLALDPMTVVGSWLLYTQNSLPSSTCFLGDRRRWSSAEVAFAAPRRRFQCVSVQSILCVVNELLACY
ncbi:hypothetical protein Ddc_06629 [Ditylenchus destructor]|nr:hypothetical protein Ddc_06629 [Ditylenchus destructor]